MIYDTTHLGNLFRQAWIAAGLPSDGITIGIDQDGTIEWSELATQQHMDIAATVIANYTPPTQIPQAKLDKARDILSKTSFVQARQNIINNTAPGSFMRNTLLRNNRIAAALTVLVLNLDAEIPDET